MKNAENLDIEFECKLPSKNSTKDNEEEEDRWDNAQGVDKDESSNQNQEGCDEDSTLALW